MNPKTAQRLPIATEGVHRIRLRTSTTVRFVQEELGIALEKIVGIH